MATTSFSITAGRRGVARRQLGDDSSQIALAVAKLEHGRRRIVDLEDPFRREQRPSPARFIAFEPHAPGEMGPRLSMDLLQLVHRLQSGRKAPGGIAPST